MQILGIECNKRDYKWWEHFIKNKREQEFEEILDSNTLASAIINMREKIVHENLNKYTVDDLKTQDENKLREVFQEMFVNYIDDDEYNYIKEIMEINQWTMEKLYEKHIKYPIRDIFRIVSVHCR